MSTIRFSDYGRLILTGREGLRLNAYLDGGGVPTIGYGHIKGVRMGDTITEDRANEYLAEDLHEVELALIRLVYVNITQNQYDALVCLVFNIGITAFSKSTLLRKLNLQDIRGAGDEFDKWIYDKGVAVNGLRIRRKIEKTLFLKDLDNYGTLIE